MGGSVLLVCIEELSTFLQPQPLCIISPGEYPDAFVAPVVIPIGVGDANVAELFTARNQDSAAGGWHGFFQMSFVPMTSASPVASDSLRSKSGIRVDDVISAGHYCSLRVLQPLTTGS